MKKRLYRNEIAKKAMVITAAGAVLTQRNLAEVIDVDGSNGTYLLKIKPTAKYVNELAKGQPFAKIAINPSAFALLEKADLHTDGLPKPSANIIPFLTGYYNPHLQKNEEPVFVLSNVDEYSRLAATFSIVTMPAANPQKVQNIIDDANKAPFNLVFNGGSPVKEVLLSESYKTRQPGLRPANQSRKIKKRASKKRR
jgi:hypothetical protein